MADPRPGTQPAAGNPQTEDPQTGSPHTGNCQTGNPRIAHSQTGAAAEPGNGRSPVDAVVGFVRVLRGAGLAAPVGADVAFAQALAVVGAWDRSAVYWAGRSTLVHRPEDIDLYDRVFAAWWEPNPLAGPPGAAPPPPPVTVTLAMDSDDGEHPGDGDEDRDEPVLQLRFSAAETLRHKDFADCTDAELAEATAVMAQLRLAGSRRRSRRLVAARPGRTGSRQPDLRRTVAAALRSHGEPVRRAMRVPGTTPRRLVLLIDVSGSMEPYARALVRFVHVAVAGRFRVEAFALGTRLTRLTRELSSHDPDEALRRAAAAVVDWSGGTRLGDGMAAFNDRWGQRGMARGAVVVVMSDGWDRGDPAVLGEQMRRLQRLAHKVVWVNPLKATPGYAPLAGGMAAALPYLDEFVEGHNLASLEELARVIAG